MQGLYGLPTSTAPTGQPMNSCDAKNTLHAGLPQRAKGHERRAFGSKPSPPSVDLTGCKQKKRGHLNFAPPLVLFTPVTRHDTTGGKFRAHAKQRVKYLFWPAQNASSAAHICSVLACSTRLPYVLTLLVG